MSGDQRVDARIAVALKRLAALKDKLTGNIEDVYKLLSELDQAGGDRDDDLTILSEFHAKSVSEYLVEHAELANGYLTELGLGPDAKKMLEEGKEFHKEWSEFWTAFVAKTPDERKSETPGDHLQLRYGIMIFEGCVNDLFAAIEETFQEANPKPQAAIDAPSPNGIPKEIRANDFKLFPKGPIEDRNMAELVIELNTHKGTKSLNEIARLYTGESKGNDSKAKSLLAAIRRLKREGRVDF